MSASGVSGLISIIPLAYLANKFGRKMILFIANPIAITSFIIALFADSIVKILVARFLQGATAAVLLTVGPTYAGETYRNEVRGSIVACFNATFSIGALFFGVIGTYLSYTTYCVVCLIFQLVGAVLILIVPESPHFYSHDLMMKNNRGRALEALEWWLRGTQNVEEEMNTIE